MPFSGNQISRLTALVGPSHKEGSFAGKESAAEAFTGVRVKVKFAVAWPSLAGDPERGSWDPTKWHNRGGP